MKLDWGNIKRLPWRDAWHSRSWLVLGGVTMWTLGLVATSYADHLRADRQTELVESLVRLQKQTRSQLAQAQTEVEAHRAFVRSYATNRAGAPVARSVEVAQADPIDKAELRDLLASTPTATSEEAKPADEKPLPQIPMAVPVKPVAESKPSEPAPAEPALAPRPAIDSEPALSAGDLAPPLDMPASLSLNPEGPEPEAMPVIPSTDNELVGIAGGKADKPADGTLAAILAASADPSDEIVDPDERRIARVAFEDAGKEFAAGKWTEAKVGYEKVLKILPKHPAALVNLGLVEERLGHDQAAREVLERALEVKPDAQPALMSLGLLYSKSGELSKAMARLTRLIELNPKDPQAHNHLGVVFAQKTWREAAETEFRTAIELNPVYQQAHFNLALMYLERTPPAIELARRHYNTAKQLGAKPDAEMDAMLASAVNLLPGEQAPVIDPTKVKTPTAAMP